MKQHRQRDQNKEMAAYLYKIIGQIIWLIKLCGLECLKRPELLIAVLSRWLSDVPLANCTGDAL